MTLRIVTPSSYDDWRPFDQVIGSSFGARWEEPKPEELEIQAVETPFDFRVGVMDGHVPVAGCASYEIELTLPGGASVPVAALTSVGGNVSSQGRGAFRAAMHEHLERARDRGHAASILNASESGLYGRFGYGHATTMVGYEIDPYRVGFRRPLDDPGSIELVLDLLPAIDLFIQAYDACAAAVPGTGSRDRIWWERVLAAKKNWRGGGSQIGVVHRDAGGAPDGYLLYQIVERPQWVNDDLLQIRELLGTSVTTELALFEFATKVPLKRHITWPEGPPDAPARHHLVDPRQLHVVDEHDLLWLRPLDIAVLLASRTYPVDDSLVLAVDDRLFADQRGPWRLTVEDGVAAVERCDDTPDLEMTPEQVAMVLLGDHRVQTLAGAGVLSGDPAAIRRFDRVFTADRRPYNLSKF